MGSTGGISPAKILDMNVDALSPVDKTMRCTLYVFVSFDPFVPTRIVQSACFWPSGSLHACFGADQPCMLCSSTHPPSSRSMLDILFLLRENGSK